MPRLLHELLAIQAALRPEHPAIFWKEDQIPYGEFDRLTNQLAQTLRAQGCRPGDRISVMIPHSANALVAVLGVLKAGCIAIPLDLKTSAKHLAEILSDLRPSAILAARGARPVLDELFAAHFLGNQAFATTSVGTLEALPIEGEHFATAFSGRDVLRQSAAPLTCPATTHSPAMLFVQDGVVVNDVGLVADSRTLASKVVPTEHSRPIVASHTDVISFVERSLDGSPFAEFDRVSALPLLSPLSLAMTFSAISIGAELHLVPHGLVSHSRQMLAFARTHELSDWLTTHETLTELVRCDLIHDGDLPSLKRVVWSGPSLPAAILRDVMPRLPLVQFAHVVGSSNRKLADQSIIAQCFPEEEIYSVEPLMLEAVAISSSVPA